MIKKAYFVAGVAALAALLGQGSQAFGYAAYYTYGNYKTGDYRSSDSAAADVHYNSFPGGTLFTLKAGESYSATSGEANASKLKLGASGWAVSTPENSFFTDAYMSTEVSNRFTVSPGTSGLALGEKTTLRLDMRVDGALHAEATAWPGKGWAHADMDAGLSIHDYSIQQCGEGCWSPAQASFGASSELEAYDVYAPYWGYSFSSPWQEGWQTSSNISPYNSYSNSGMTKEHGEAMHYEAGRSFDTGVQTLEFEAIVGHTLDIDAYLNLYVNANQNGEAWADFSKTFAFSVTPSAAGTQIDWEIAPQPVPVPGALPLLGSGLLLLNGLRRKRNKSHLRG